jgi:hypothetical protein
MKGIDSKILLYQTPNYQWEPSTVYRYKDFLDALRCEQVLLHG